MERGARLMADAVKTGFALIGAGKAQVSWVTDVPVKMMTMFTPGPLSHPYPERLQLPHRADARRVDRRARSWGCPDCFRDAPGTDALSPLYDNLVGLGIPLPANYDATTFGGVEENLRIKLQAVRIGEVLLVSCSCEAQSDLILNLESRTDKTQGNIFDGYDCAPTCKAKADGDYDCADPREFFKVKRISVTKAAYDRMVAQVHNDAAGWDDPSYALQANSEPADPAQIKGNFTKTELPANLGYTLPSASATPATTSATRCPTGSS